MPDADGLKAPGTFDESKSTRATTTFLLSESTGVPDPQKCSYVRMDDYYQKPILPEHFAQIVSKWIKPNGGNSDE
jgi:hypothetical protein